MSQPNSNVAQTEKLVGKYSPVLNRADVDKNALSVEPAKEPLLGKRGRGSKAVGSAPGAQPPNSKRIKVEPSKMTKAQRVIAYAFCQLVQDEVPMYGKTDPKGRKTLFKTAHDQLGQVFGE